jgi:hypothetical protein
MTTPPLPEQIELHRDCMWRRDEDLRVECAVDAERFIEDLGFANTLTDAHRSGPLLYIAVCGRRDVSLPRSSLKGGRRTKAKPGPGLRSCDSRAAAPRSFDNTTVANDRESQIASLMWPRRRFLSISLHSHR